MSKYTLKIYKMHDSSFLLNYKYELYDAKELLERNWTSTIWGARYGAKKYIKELSVKKEDRLIREESI